MSYLHDGVELNLIHLRPLVRRRVKLVSDLDGLGSRHILLQELVLDLLVHVDTRRSTADLAVVEEDAHVGPLHGIVDVCVLEYDGGGFAAEFQGDLLQVGLGGGLEEETAGTGRAGEGDLVDVGVLNESGA